mmetsp:Transcript_31754/g.64488  ORF Transcript_31754/g.64488 Transcript_31754/m.64488 type:complete len:89 (-) Transcript_31754:177-443(-)
MVDDFDDRGCRVVNADTPNDEVFREKPNHRDVAVSYSDGGEGRDRDGDGGSIRVMEHIIRRMVHFFRTEVIIIIFIFSCECFVCCFRR